MPGRNDILVLLHPFPLDASFWGPTWRALDGNVRALTPEFPGFGGAPPRDAPSIAGFADEVAAQIADTGKRAIVCGLSLGGYVALALVARHPELVSGLLLANTRAEADGAQARIAREQAFDTIRIDGLDTYLDAALPRLVAPDADAGVLDRLWAIAGRQDPDAVAAALMALRDREDRTQVLPTIAVPTAVVGAQADELTPPTVTQNLAAAIPGATHHALATGHLSALEAPVEFAALLRDLLTRVGQAAAAD